MTRHKSNCGQAYVLTILFLVVLLGMAAAVVDVGSWYRAHRALQATVDAAALAGAQKLPESTGQAGALASQYAAKNGGGSMQIAFSTQVYANDTITVTTLFDNPNQASGYVYVFAKRPTTGAATGESCGSGSDDAPAAVDSRASARWAENGGFPFSTSIRSSRHSSQRR